MIEWVLIAVFLNPSPQIDPVYKVHGLVSKEQCEQRKAALLDEFPESEVRITCTPGKYIRKPA